MTGERVEWVSANPRRPWIPRAAYDPPYRFVWAEGDYLPGPSAFDEWVRRTEILARLDELRPHEFLVITQEVRPI